MRALLLDQLSFKAWIIRKDFRFLSIIVAVFEPDEHIFLFTNGIRLRWSRIMMFPISNRDYDLGGYTYIS